MTEPVRVFISHHHSPEENAFTARLTDDLRAAGADVWVDDEAILSDDFVKRINEGLTGRDWLVLVMTPAAIESVWVQQEVNAALNQVRKNRMRGVIPIVAQRCEDDQIPVLWDTLHRFDSTSDYDAALKGLFRSLGLALLGPATTVAPDPAPVVETPAPTQIGVPNDDSPLAPPPPFAGQYESVVEAEPIAEEVSTRRVEIEGDPHTRRFDSVVGAIESAEPGARILIYPGIYREIFPAIKKSVELFGQGKASDVILECEVDLQQVSMGIRVYTRVQMNNLTVLGTTQTQVVVVLNEGQLFLTDCVISSYPNRAFEGLTIAGMLTASRTRIEGTWSRPGTIQEDNQGPIQVHGYGCWVGGQATFHSCTIRTFYIGVEAYGEVARVTMRHSTITRCHIAVYIQSRDNLVEDSDLRGNNKVWEKTRLAHVKTARNREK
jgi:hypothetical protein